MIKMYQVTLSAKANCETETVNILSDQSPVEIGLWFRDNRPEMYVMMVEGI